MLNFFKKKKRKVTDMKSIDSKPTVIKTPNIEINSYENLIIVDIKEYCTITEYCDYLKNQQLDTLFDKIWNSTIWDSSKQQVKKNKIYYCVLSNAEYNIYNNNNKIYIAERRSIQDNSLWVDEIVLTLNKKDNSYQIARLKHDESRSTFYTKFYNSNKKEETIFYLEDANNLANHMLERLNLISNIDKIIDIDAIKNIIREDEIQLLKKQ